MQLCSTWQQTCMQLTALSMASPWIAVPVLDALAQVPGLTVVNCNNELACAYAADGYARARPHSLGCCITTFLVGALSSINGVAGSFAEELAVLNIVGESVRAGARRCDSTALD